MAAPPSRWVNVCDVPSLFKRKVEEEAVDETPAEESFGAAVRPRGHTPSKRELGKVTPKRQDTTRRRVAEPPANTKEARQRQREKAKQDRIERREGMMNGDDRYLLARDKGPERALVRDLVDRRLTIGTWFFGGALLVLVGSSRAMPQLIQVVSNLLWALLAAATLIDSLLIAREIKREVKARFPKTEQRMGSLYLYGAMRGLTFRRLRMPKPRVKIGTKV
ncbi:hypothetical protein Val02_73920 [Virgisporangium aliadipatigenens]|uniref:DUF3043 domain-containing protein n=1 Tax=Virgisporangium aliadipatigenens TaxID=741659 RepID=A0A8J3YS63_9ACTN|nr:hypothetical protein Val02_73920 [Virgisporangium aliadipatigenens]